MDKFSPSVIFITYGYSGFVVFCWILLFVLKNHKDILQLKFIIISYINSLERRKCHFDFLPSRKEFNVDPPNIHTTWQWTHSGKHLRMCKIVCYCYKYICNWGWISSVHLSYSSPMDTLILLYFAESSFLCRFRVESVNGFVLPRSFQNILLV
jgi:hypothetical protein